MEVFFPKDEPGSVTIKTGGGPMNTISIDKGNVVVVHKDPKTPAQKRHIVNNVISSIYKSKAARRKHYI